MVHLIYIKIFNKNLLIGYSKFFMIIQINHLKENQILFYHLKKKL